MQGRQALRLAPRYQRVYQRRARIGVHSQQARAGHGRKRHSDHRLGVVGQAVLLVGVGPGPVKHVFAVRMVFDIQRARRYQLAFPF